MRCRLATILVLLALAAGPVAAGPWARAEGEGFLSFTVTGDTDGRTLWSGGEITLSSYAGLFGEYGLGRGLTLAARLGRSDTAEEADLFLRYTLSDPGTAWQVALHGGVALRGSGDRLLRLGVSVGRGFGAAEQRRWWWPVTHQSGWTALDLAAFHDLEAAATIWEAEATLGLSLSEQMSVMVQVKAEVPTGGDPFFTLMPSAAWSLTERSTLQVGARLGGRDGNRAGLSLSLWHSF